MDFLFGYVAYLFNTCLTLENSEKLIQQQLQQLTCFLSAFLTQKWIFTPMESDIWRQVHCEFVFFVNLKLKLFFSANAIDLEYCKSVLEILCQNAMLVNPININWLRICGDFYFGQLNLFLLEKNLIIFLVTERFEEAIAYYLEVVIAARRKFYGEVLDFDLDNVY